jgi:tetratricopeptide (TPR) repeat protein
MPVLPVLLAFAAWTLLALCRHLAARRWRRLAYLGLPLGVLLVALNLPAVPPTEQDAQLHGDLGEVYLRKGEYQQAVVHLRRALELEPDYNYARHNLATAYFHLGHRPESIQIALQTIAENPRRPDTRVLLGRAYLDAGQLGEASLHLERALQIDPQSGMAHYYYGRLLYRQGRYLEAVAHLEQARRWQPRDFWICYELGRAYQQSGRLDQALLYYQQAQALENRPEALNALGAVHFLAGRLDQARAYFDQALSLDPDHAEAHVNLALLDLEQGRLTQAIARLQQVLDAHPRSLAAGRALVEAYTRAGHTKQAETYRRQLETLRR